MRSLIRTLLPVLLLAAATACTEAPAPTVSPPPGIPIPEALPAPGPHMRLALPEGLEAIGLEEPRPPGRSDEAALAEARRGRLGVAASRCDSSDCFSQVAALGAARLGAPVYATAAQVCVRADDPLACHRALIEALAGAVPPADAPAAEWERLVQTAAIVEATWTRMGEGALALAAVEHLWVSVLDQSYAVVAENTAAPLQHLPVAAHPHVRAALVARAARDAGAPETLEAWLARLPVDAEAGAGRDGEVLWRREGDRLRPSVADPAVDLRVCVLLVSGLDGQAVPDGRWRAAAQALK